MHLAFVASRTQAGLAAHPVTAEIHLGNGLPGFQIVGLSETATREVRSRVKSAIASSHLKWPDFNITVNLAPADHIKQGARFDLPIALGLLVASGQLPPESIDNREFFGELGLDGTLRSFPGALAAVLAATEAGRYCGIAIQGAERLAMIEESQLIGAPDLLTLCAHLKRATPPLLKRAPTELLTRTTYPDLSQLRGQSGLCHVLEVAAAGGHHLLMVGPPGVGKTLAASVLPGLLPPPPASVQRETCLLYDVAGALSYSCPPFRAPHHSSSVASLIGGTAMALPGEISMAHGGVLFLDELAEFPRAVLNQLRQPLENGEIDVTRAAHRYRYPARFQLVAAMNPCPCGFLGEAEGQCRCTPDIIRRYRQSVSGPLMDRIDLHVSLHKPSPRQLLTQNGATQESNDVKHRVAQAQCRQYARQQCLNRELSGDDLLEACSLSASTRTYLIEAVEALGLSARSVHRRLRVARTLADLSGSEPVEASHLNTALSLREAPAPADAVNY
jgi:magnesium chelatase family protein